MRLNSCATIVVAAIAIGGTRAHADDWDPQPGQGTHVQTEKFDWIYVDKGPNNTVITAPNGLLTVGSNPNFHGTLLATIPSNTGPTKLEVKIKASHDHKNPYKNFPSTKYPDSPAKKEYEIEYGKGRLKGGLFYCSRRRGFAYCFGAAGG